MRTHGRFAYSQKRREADAAVRDLGADAAAVGLGGRSGNGQADARAADGVGMRLVRAVKPVEEPGNVKALCTGAGVEHLYLRLFSCLGDAERYFAALVGVFDGIVQQNGDHLLHGLPVAGQEDAVLDLL